jgi:2'-5' RNA ligase
MTIPRPTSESPRLCVLISLPLPAEIADRLPDPRPGVRPHITLAGPCDVTEEQARKILDAFTAGAVSTGSPVPVTLRGVGDFRNDDPPHPVVFVEVVSGFDRLVALAEELDAEFGLTRRFDPHPHVTLAYWLDDDELDRIAAAHHGFEAECEISTVNLQFGIGTDTTPRVNTWGAGRAFAIA